MSTLTTYNGIQVVTPDPTGAGGLAINNNFKGLSTHIDTTDPTASNDSSQGYVIGSRWFNSTSETEWICLDNTVSAASWESLGTTSGVYLPLSGGNMSGAINMEGQNINMYNGFGSGGGSLNMEGGTINFDGSSSLATDGSGNLTFTATSISGLPAPALSGTAVGIISMAGYNLNMNTGGGSGGGTLNMDGGQTQMGSGGYIQDDGSGGINLVSSANTVNMDTRGNLNLGPNICLGPAVPALVLAPGLYLTNGSSQSLTFAPGFGIQFIGTGMELSMQGNPIFMTSGGGGSAAHIQDDGSGGINLFGISSVNPINIANSGSLNILANTINMNSGGGSGGGTLNMDGGPINAASLMQLAPQGTAPAPVAGGIYFDGTSFYKCSNGTTWVAF